MTETDMELRHARIPTGIANLDTLLGKGIPKGSVTVVAGSPGSGKTTVAQQICFHNATKDSCALYFSTLSQPSAKSLLFLSQFAFFDAEKVGSAVQFIDLGIVIRGQGIGNAGKLVMDEVLRAKPLLVVIDSYRMFDDLARSSEDLRKFTYQLAINLMARGATTLLLGEYSSSEIDSNPLFSIADGLIVLSQGLQSGEQQRFLQIIKMRGTDHSREEHPFMITAQRGVEVFAPRLTIERDDRASTSDRCLTGISKLDQLLGHGIPRGSSLLIAGVAGTGKTVLGLEFVYRGALAGERGLIFSFEETSARLRAEAKGLGWELDREIDSGMVKIVFIPQPNIMIEQHLLMMKDTIEQHQARRVAIDSISVFLHKVKDPQVAREKVFQISSIVQNAQAVGFFATDIPYGANRISRFGVEETVVDGVILLTSTQEGFERQRYLEVYKLRNTAHSKGRHNMVIQTGGIEIFPRYDLETTGLTWAEDAPVARLASGVPGLDGLLGGGLIDRSVTLVSGSAGIGKTTSALQFLLKGVQVGQHGLFIALEEGPEQLLRVAANLGLPLADAIASGQIEVVYLSREHVRANQFPTIIADQILKRGVSRLVIDSVSHMVTNEVSPGEVRQLLFNLVARVKALGVTCLFTIESTALHSTDSVTDQGFSPVADNLLMLRYRSDGEGFLPTLAVVKTRGSKHDRHSYQLEMDMGGLSVGARLKT